TAVSMTLQSSLNPSSFTESVTFTAKVSTGGDIPTGSITFFDGLTSLGTVPLHLDSAQVSTSTLSGGSHSIKAVYSGDSTFQSDSSSITQIVNQASPTVSLASSQNPSTFDQPVTFTAKVQSGLAAPTGSVTFFD